MLDVKDEKKKQLRRVGSGGIVPAFLTSALDRGEFRILRNGRFAPGDRAPGTHWIGN
jgi:hypothetical protein